MSATPDPIRLLQAAARSAAGHVAPGDHARRVIVLGGDGVKLVDVTVPVGGGPAHEPAALTPAVRPGWDVDDRRALFDGEPVRVAASRLRLLKVLADADRPMTAKELTAAAFDKATDVQNTRYHIRELRRELGEAFPNFEGHMVQGNDEGYLLVLR